MTPSKPRGICWCHCHMPVDDSGARRFDVVTDDQHVNGWPRFDAPVALASACASCRRDHILFIDTGRDWLWDRDASLSEGTTNNE